MPQCEEEELGLYELIDLDAEGVPDNDQGLDSNSIAVAVTLRI